jgi:hypothetical protein
VEAIFIHDVTKANQADARFNYSDAQGPQKMTLFTDWTALGKELTARKLVLGARP